MQKQESTLVNRVAKSGIITLDLVSLIPDRNVVLIDLRDFLFQGLILREKPFRQALKEYAWEKCSDRDVLVFCSTDAIIPMWAYMLIAKHASPYAKSVFFGNEQEYNHAALLEHIENLNPEDYKDKRVVVKGCGDEPIPASAYLSITQKLIPVVKSLMYGEPCSTVPVYKKR